MPLEATQPPRLVRVVDELSAAMVEQARAVGGKILMIINCGHVDVLKSSDSRRSGSLWMQHTMQSSEN